MVDGGGEGSMKRVEVKEEADEIEAEDDLTEYEKLRKANIDRNKLILEALELPSVPVPAKGEAGMVSVRARGLKGTRKQEEVLPTRERSLRVQGKTPDGQQLELPPDWREPIRFNSSSRKEAGGGCSSGMKAPEDETSERRTGNLAVADCVPVDSWAEDPAAHLSKACSTAQDLIAQLHVSDVEEPSRVSSTCRLDMSLDVLKALEVSESDVAKVCPQRIASIASTGK